VCGENDIVLTSREVSALLQVSVQSLHGVTVNLDPKIVRAVLVTPGRSLERGTLNDLRADSSERPPAPGLRRE